MIANNNQHIKQLTVLPLLKYDYKHFVKFIITYLPPTLNKPNI